MLGSPEQRFKHLFGQQEEQALQEPGLGLPEAPQILKQTNPSRQNFLQLFLELEFLGLRYLPFFILTLVFFTVELTIALIPPQEFDLQFH